MRHGRDTRWIARTSRRVGHGQIRAAAFCASTATLQHGIQSQFRNLWTSDVPGDKFRGQDAHISHSATPTTSQRTSGSTTALSRLPIRRRGHRIQRAGPHQIALRRMVRELPRQFPWHRRICEHGRRQRRQNGSAPWKRHPTADVNIGAHSGYASSLTSTSPTRTGSR